MSLRIRLIAVALIASLAPYDVVAAQDDDPTLIHVERLEYLFTDGNLLWDTQRAEHPEGSAFLWKFEGLITDRQLDSAELMLLGQQETATGINAMAGLSLLRTDEAHMSSLVLGASYQSRRGVGFELLSLISESGAVFLRSTTEHEFGLTERLTLQPKFELNIASQSVPELGIGPGIHELIAGLRLRYSFSSNVAPYIGVTYFEAFGRTREWLSSAGASSHQTTAIAGIRFSF